MKKHRILFLSEYDPLDKRAWSGTLYHMHTQLCKYFDVTNTGPIPYLSGFWKWAFNIFASINHRIFKKYYDTGHSKLVGRLNLKKIKDQVYGNYDFIYAPIASRELSQIKNSKTPILYASDITFDLIRQKYGFEILYKFSEKEGDEVERLAIIHATLCLYSSDWAAQSAINTYGARPENIFVVPFGANINNLPNYNFDEKIKFETLEILFLGVDWIRKGGEMVLKTYKLLKSQGINVHLTICGCVPPLDLSDTDITVIPFLNKNNSEDLKTFDNLLANTQLLFVPSKEDCTPIVFCEAAAYGIPVITRDEGGISSMVKNGINGYCLSSQSTELDYANIITKIIDNKELYSKLSLISREMYLKTFNWDSWGKSVSEIIINHLTKNVTNTL